MSLIRRHYQILGTVQGVGFRPFVYRHATDNDLTGSVLNDANGVSIEVQGTEAQLAPFDHAMHHQLPPLARVDHLQVTPQPTVDGESAFIILESSGKADAQVALATDKASCPDCLADIADPGSRYYRYPFTNCTNCGPRYTIIRDLPYDRPNTAMAGFKMCPACAKEYQDPLNRRYHAQPVSCPHCGPQLSWRRPGGQLEAVESPLQHCARQLLDGQIIAIKGLGGYHLMCDATNAEAVDTLRRRKQRPAKPLAVMVKDRASAERLVQGDAAEWETLCSLERPITLMRTTASTELADGVAPGIDRLGLFLPYTPIHQLLLEQLDRPLVATSANLSGEPVITELSQLVDKLGHVADGILDHDRPILNPCDDSVVQVVQGRRQWWRLARGIAPQTERLPEACDRTILAVGAQQKNRLALAFGQRSIVSPHIGDLDNLATEGYFEHTLAQLQRIYGLHIDQLVGDLHQGYGSSQWASHYAEQHRLPQLQVQHHYAHVLAVMAEHQHLGPVLGFAFDGTGLGDDGQLWGGEVLLADTQGYQRLHHVKPFRLIGGEQAIKHPARVALSLLFQHADLDCIQASGWPQRLGIDAATLSNLHLMWSKGINSPYSSSMGRLFDAMASFLQLCQHTDFDGQAGMLLEASAEPVAQADLQLPLSLNDQGQIDTAGLIQYLLPRGDQALDTAHCARAFIDGIAEMMVALMDRYPQHPIVLCGGVMQNRCLLENLLQRMGSHHQRLMWPERTPVNDSGIAQGQLWYALNHPGSGE
ncbi:carbamoyltransferase HypF [Ferrimonas sp. SCSIO 43195]|uniref:carbamoyltransferase HypF n=1 Tax=Ferrimonas sp. SCSIO 43195 TaxID=2822844 RepID=UPI002075A0BA|nr:carbamoyltransferase HypF [Ferrimonas sp. SCSIO 43195]USD36875.1 carbamoyltransferase HypF [Ferrimonas sp. SCSIO 43195]